MEFPQRFTVRTITARRIILAPAAPRGKFGEDRAPFQPTREASARAEPGFAGIAIARTHALTILTRNLKHLAVFGVPTRDPFRSLPK